MNEEILDLLELSLELELKIAELYRFYSRCFSEDAAFWWKLSMEEGNHAALIKSGIQNYAPVDKYPKEMIYPVTEEWKDLLRFIDRQLDQFTKKSPDREQAVQLAIALENSAGEKHYQNAMEYPEGSRMLKLFQRLNDGDRDHAQRIRHYFKIEESDSAPDRNGDCQNSGE